MQCKQRLYLTADRKRLVAAGDKRAATLYATPGDEIPQSAADKFGLVDGALKGFDADAGAKEDRGGQDKERKPGADKGNGGAGGSGGAAAPPPDDLAALKGVGDKTAGLLAAGGLTTFAAIAAIDPANPPAIEGIARVFKWSDVVASAKSLAPAAPADQPQS